MSGKGASAMALGWRLDVDEAAGELRLEHAASETTYVLDADGGLHVPGDADVEADLEALRETLAPRREGEAMTDGSGSRCAVECDEATGEVTIESDSKISLSAPTIELASRGNLSVDASGVLTLEGALIKLN